MWEVTNFQFVLWQEFAPSDEELEAYRKGEEWDPQLAEQRRRLKVKQLFLHSDIYYLKFTVKSKYVLMFEKCS